MINLDSNNTKRNNFIGHDGFVWWVGVVENRLDPLNLGRCQIRIKGLHSEKKTLIPTESLPWSQPLFPVNQSFSVPSTLKEGDIAVGFFLDGDSAQFPIVFGMLHGIPEDAANPNSGFNDPRTQEQLKLAPRKPNSGSGVSYPDTLNEPTIDRLARNESIDNTIVKSKNDGTVTVDDAVNSQWKEPKTPYNAKYPYNHVIASESGHYFELDDTPGSERTHLYHRSGTFTETHPSGTQVEKIVKDKYTIILGNDNIFVSGDCDITVGGNAKILVKKDCYLTVSGNMNQKIGKDLNVTVGGNINTIVTGEVNQTCAAFNHKGNIFEVGKYVGSEDVIAAGISLDEHQHADPQGGVVSPPI